MISANAESGISPQYHFVQFREIAPMLQALPLGMVLGIAPSFQQTNNTPTELEGDTAFSQGGMG
jgi:hypothetical protein